MGHPYLPDEAWQGFVFELGIDERLEFRECNMRTNLWTAHLRTCGEK
jgi:hypothetical protein